MYHKTPQTSPFFFTPYELNFQKQSNFCQKQLSLTEVDKINKQVSKIEPSCEKQVNSLLRELDCYIVPTL